MPKEQIRNLAQTWPMPSQPRPVVIIGAGSIVTDAHLPAYRKAGFPVAGIFDIDRSRAVTVASAFGVETVFRTLEEAIGVNAVLDLALPPDQIMPTLNHLPNMSVVLIQKPMGTNLAEARAIRDLCAAKSLISAVNLQLRFSPMMLAVRDAIAQDLIGEITDLDIHLTLQQPWQQWPFMETLEAVELPMHSIHYLDWIRSVLGEPEGVYCKSVAHPDFPQLADARSSIILDYGNRIRCSMALNHTYKHGPGNRDASVLIDGQAGAAWIKLGALLNYPTGEAEEVEISTGGSRFMPVPLSGRWFPDAFIGVMSNLQRFAAGEDDVLATNTNNAFRTMALVDACIRSSRSGSTAIHSDAVTEQKHAI